MSPWWPLPNWAQQGSFVEPVNPPGVDFDSAPLTCVRFSQAWLPYVMGALQQLIQPSSWVVADNVALNDVLLNASDLIGSIGQGGDCVDFQERLQDCVLQYSLDGGSTWVDVAGWAANLQACIAARTAPPVPANPGGTLPSQNACNLSGWLASQVLQAAAAAQAANRAAANDENVLIKSLLNDVFGGSPLINGIINAGYGLFVTTQGFPNTDLVTASTDAGLLTSMTKAIFDATTAKGYVDASNFAQVAANLAAISYPAASWVPAMLSNFWTNLTLTTIQNMQAKGVLNVANCDAFDTPWCHYINFGSNDGGATVYPGYASHYDGIAWRGDLVPSLPAYVGCGIVLDMGHTVSITEVQVDFNSNNGNTSGRPHVVAVQAVIGTHVCSASVPFPFQDPGFAWTSGAVVCSGRYIVVVFETPSAGGGAVSFAGVQVRGIGVNPFAGFGPCVVGP